MAKLTQKQESLVAELVKELENPTELFATGGLLDELQKRFVERS